MKNAPSKIYLQIGDVGEHADFNDLLSGEITWSETRINDNDIEYSIREALELQEASRWISVEDETPKDGQKVFVKHELGEGSRYWRDGGMMEEYTHWMPIPKIK